MRKREKSFYSGRGHIEPANDVQRRIFLRPIIGRHLIRPDTWPASISVAHLTSRRLSPRIETPFSQPTWNFGYFSEDDR